MKIKTQKQLYLIFTIISLLIAGIVILFIRRNNLPYEFRVDLKEPIGEMKIAYIYEDLDFDGISEKIKLASAFQKAVDNSKTSNDNIIVYNNNDVIIDQFNLLSYSDPAWIHFEDYNNDNYKEIFAFSQLNDSLFLTVINVKTQQYILHRQFVLSKPDSAKKDFWDIWVHAARLLNVDNDKPKELIFQVVGAYSIYPRSIYSYDIEEKKILNEFETSSILHIAEFSDINNDGTDEILLSTNATGNVKEKKGFHDSVNWLFVLNKNLIPIFTPKEIGNYPGFIYTCIITNQNVSELFVINNYTNKTKNIRENLLFNLKGKLKDTLNYLPKNLKKPLKVVENGKDFIYNSTDEGKLIKLDSKLKIVKSEHFNGKHWFISEIEYDTNNKKALLLSSNQSLYIIDKDLNLLCSFHLDEIFNSFKNNYSVKYNGKNKFPQLKIIGEKNNYLFTIVENKIYSYLSLILLSVILLSFLLLVGFHKIMSFLSTYIKYFGYSLNKSSKGVALLNSSGKIFYSNTNITEYLNLKNSMSKRESYKNIFKGRNDVISAIDSSLNTQEKVKKELHISTTDYQFEGSLSITPFTSFIGFTYAYLMEVSDFTEPLLTDRGKVWGATLQRIAHEIKTPLSTLILSLDNLKNRLTGKNVDVNEEINMMQSELERIKQLTKNFMIFTNLEKPKIDKVSLSKVLNESIKVFRSYFEKGMMLKFNDEDYYVLADEKQLTQLFSLLIENAIDACNGKGEILIKTENGKPETGEREKDLSQLRIDEIEKLASELEDEYTKIIISDDGKGMSEEVLQKIFEPYFTTKKDGTGMGLSLSKKIIEDNRGMLEIYSKEGAGTEVVVYLQIAK